MVAVDEFCLYHGTIETASPYVSSKLLEYKAGKAKHVQLLHIDDAVCFMLCAFIVRFNYHEITLAIRSGSDLLIIWTSILNDFFLKTTISAQEILLISLVKTSLEICCGALRYENYDAHLELTTKLMRNFIDLAGENKITEKLQDQMKIVIFNHGQ
eukprot:CAMPEP_0185019874 /NCGR_PEP_ID=MMETSP1103-20130426/2453_1 /TAXON_ID=36769 /ORGANISM="Paraphysomonas bandaiensis, Strain Caron Lab Isolate" /LENGTH=155 /DNA_ID=CAMNT_0027550413 /DNA_START=1332 /DNA_END=1799 /DNA_ORIENTATION=-